MAHEYSVQTHAWIADKMAQAKIGQQVAEKNNDIAGKEYFSGQIKELEFIRSYLTDRIDLDTQTYYQ